MYTKYTRVDTLEEIESTQQGSESWEHFVLPQQDIYNTGLQRPLQIYVKPRVIKHKQRGGEQRSGENGGGEQYREVRRGEERDEKRGEMERRRGER